MYPGNEEAVIKLIANAANNDAALLDRIQAAHDFRLLSEAIKTGDIEAVFDMLEENPSIAQLANKKGQTALHIAAEVSASTSAPGNSSEFPTGILP